MKDLIRAILLFVLFNPCRWFVCNFCVCFTPGLTASNFCIIYVHSHLVLSPRARSVRVDTAFVHFLIFIYFFSFWIYVYTMYVCVCTFFFPTSTEIIDVYNRRIVERLIFQLHIRIPVSNDYDTYLWHANNKCYTYVYRACLVSVICQFVYYMMVCMYILLSQKKSYEACDVFASV